jgi:alkylation response protein AidB-like acyl-CoA dehydrogenase
MPAGKATVEANRFRLSGRWPFARGVQHAEWITASAWIQGDGPAGERAMMSFPASAATLHDNW